MLEGRHCITLPPSLPLNTATSFLALSFRGDTNIPRGGHSTAYLLRGAFPSFSETSLTNSDINLLAGVLLFRPFDKISRPFS